ncbi:MAG: Nex18 symbiotically induced protein [Cytophagales bacterium CG12_big_fil_rev_8_21_14_0_65_40_12]|nr:MAG: Nex18 symbiotically induced protein [Cytophagales bacterium CG12_big_fil_rev_8_21_14_0_65_40_12]PIW05158.1 MAG: Nex18 symbiotically induced protein [Cytophagales bacterium CG17_big_fil_post_rev_8_21_14_2_50_40_13]
MKTQKLRNLFLGVVVALFASFNTVKAQDIVDLAVGQDNLKTLVAAVKAAGLVDVLKGKGPFTVFAPTDAAFAALPAGTLEMLLKPENKDKLVAILTYHVVAGQVMSTDLSNGQEAATVQGEKVKVSIYGGKVKISGANVIAADVKASNGVVHVIDAVILPPTMK